MKRFLALALSAIMLVSIGSVAVGCSGGDTDIDPNRIQLNIAVADDGIGKEYYEYLKTEYEKINPDVQVQIQNRDSLLSNKDQAVTAISDDIAMMGFSDYTSYGSYLMDITDIYQSKAFDAEYNYVGMGNGTVSVYDRLDENERKTYNNGTEASPEFKVLPFYNSVFGFWYDVDLFNGTKYTPKLYDWEGLKGLDGIEGTADDNLGPDGVEGTYDDGLPATWEDFKALLLYMKNENISKKPFTWSATEDWSQQYALDQIVANYEGKNDYTLNYTFNGTHSKLGEITLETGWKISQVINNDMPYRQGTKAAIYFSDFVRENQLYSEGSLLPTQTHLVAQTDYLGSILNGDQRSAFILEGSWWQYEARDTFASLAKRDPNYAYGKRNFALFPFPKFIGTNGIIDQDATDKNIFPMSGFSNFIPLKIAETNGKGDLVKDFLLFAMDNKHVKKFIEINAVLPTVDIKYTETELNSWNYMARSQIEFLNESTTEVVMMRNSSTLSTKFGPREQFGTYFRDYNYGSEINGITKQNPLEDMCIDNINFSKYWNGIMAVAESQFNQTSWANGTK